MTIRDLIKNRVMILDGAMGTMLGKYEAEQLTFPERLNITDPSLVADIHRRYADAGADIISTFTLKANRYQAKTHGVDLETLIQNACHNARSGAPKAFIALSVGPLRQGKAQTTEKWREQYCAFSEVIGYGQKAGIDAVLLESFDDVDEARMAILAARSQTDLPVLVSFAVGAQNEAAAVAMFDRIAVVIQSLDVDAIGLNCSLSPEPMVDHFLKLKERVIKPLFVQPNAGRYKLSGSKRFYLQNVELFKSAMARCTSEGAALVGGCCGTTPQYIQSISHLKKTYCRPAKKRVSIDQICIGNLFEPIHSVLIASPFDAFGRNDFHRAIACRDTENILGKADRMRRSGFDRMGLFVGEIRDTIFLQDLVLNLTYRTGIQLVFSAVNLNVLEAMLTVYPQRAIIDGPWPTVEKRQEAYRLSRRYGAEVVLKVEPVSGLLPFEQRVLQAIELVINESQAAGVERKSLILEIDADSALREGTTYIEILALLRTLRNTCHVQTIINLESLMHSVQDSEALASTFCVLAMAQGVNYLAVNADQSIYTHLLSGLRAMSGVVA